MGRHPLEGCDNQATMSQPHHKLLDVVELRTDSGRWPAGTVGTAVEVDDDRVLVEISDDRGHGLDFIALPHHALAAHKPRTTRRIAS
jgi:hypothetical protein